MPQAATARAPQSKACCFGRKQDLSLPDYIECSLTLQYNNSYNNYYTFLSFIVSVRELRFFEHNLRIIAEKCKNSSNKI